MSAEDETRPIPATTSAGQAGDPAGGPGQASGPAFAPGGPASAGPDGHIRVVQPPVYAEEHRGPRVGTVVWGLVVAAVGIGLLAVAWGANLDAQLALIVLLGAAGVALLVGSLLGMRRSRAREEGRG